MSYLSVARQVGAKVGIGVVLGVLFSAVTVPLAASANTLDEITLSSSTVAPGATVTVSAQWTSSDLGQTNRALSLVFPAGLTGASWSSEAMSPQNVGENCVSTPADQEVACLWGSDSGDVVTISADLVLDPATPAGVYAINAISDPDAGEMSNTIYLTVVADATPAVEVTPSSTTPGTTAMATATFTALNSGSLNVGVYLTGTAGAGTFGTPVIATGLTDCVLDVSERAYGCTWEGATVGDTRTISIPIDVATGATPGSWTVEACDNRNNVGQSCASTALAITDPSAGPATPTVPTLPATGSPLETPAFIALSLSAIAALGMGVALVTSRRRSSLRSAMIWPVS